MNLKSQLANNGKISAPGVFDPFSARIAESAGFPTLYMTGYGVNATLLGQPDAGFASYSEMVNRLHSIALVTDAAIIADGDTGFGGLPNVERAVRGYEASGADAIQIEDQEFPKRCGHTKNRKVIAAPDMVKKVQVACRSRSSDDFMIVARTDALSEHGQDEALRRAEAYLNAGADILFVESPETNEQMRTICERFKGTPMIANMVAGGRTPLLSDQELFDLGFQIVIHPIYLLGAILEAVKDAAQGLRNGVENPVADINDLNAMLDFEHIWSMDEEFK
jgi:2-methylisocitrate lyase-like PEP mutase family enzyme